MVKKMEKEYKCINCKIVYPASRLLFKCEVDECEVDECDHEIKCGFCLLLKIPAGAKINMDALMEIL